MSYNKRLAITQADYTKLESLLSEFMGENSSQVVKYLDQYFKRAKIESYTKTRIVFDIYYVLIRFISLDIICRHADYDFLSQHVGGGLEYLNDSTLESALTAILYDEKSPAYIGAK